MKFIWRWVCRRIDEERSGRLAVPELARNHAISKGPDWHDNLNITITSANGGKILTFKRYDHRTDRHSNTIYVISDDLDFNAELGKLITLESMRG